jgi:hypothetical protein
MPQLDLLSYMTQVLGAMGGLTFLYLLIVRIVLPKLKTLQAIRTWWSEEQEEGRKEQMEILSIPLDLLPQPEPSTTLSSLYLQQITQHITQNETLRTI